MNDLVVVLQPDSSQALRLQQILFELGEQSVWVDNGEKAVKIFETMGPPKLLLVEPSLCGMDGFEVIRILREKTDSKSSPVIVISAYPGLLSSALELRASLGIAAVTSLHVSAMTLGDLIREILHVGNAGRLQWTHPEIKLSLPLSKPLPPPAPQRRSPDPVKAAGLNEPAGRLLETLTREVTELRSIVSVDPLTGLANQRAGVEAGRREAGRSRRTKRAYAVMAFDLDHFNEFNDKEGHEAGDRVLKAMASVIAKGIRNSDVPVRWSGDRFLVILAESTNAQAKKLAGRMLAKLTDKKEMKGTKVFVGTADSSAGPGFSAVVEAAERALN